MSISNTDRAKKYRLARQKQRTSEEIIKVRDKLIIFTNKNPYHHSIDLLYKQIKQLNIRLKNLKES